MNHRTAPAALVAALVLALALVPSAFGAKGPKSSSSSSSLNLVLVNSTDGLPHWGQQVRFDVSTTQTDQPHVSLQCSQDGSVVYSAQTGYYDGYAWPWTQTMTLSSASWTGGAADCSARLYSLDNSGKSTTLATLGFHVYP